MDIMKTLAALGIGYLLGSLNFSVIVAWFYGVDIRSQGSKNAGLTNTLRVLGKSAAALVLLGDILKGVVACLIGSRLGVYAQTAAGTDCVSLLAAGAGAVIGHNWPVYFQFKGGKGALTAAAVMIMINGMTASISLTAFVVIVAVSRYVSLGTIGATVLFVALSWVPGLGGTMYFQATALLLALIIVAKHRDNIRRLLSGTENKLRI